MLMAKEINRRSVMNELMKHKDLIQNEKIKEKIDLKLKEREQKTKSRMEKKGKL